MHFIIVIFLIFISSLSASAQLFGKKWVDGKLYHISGEVFTGQISWSPPPKSGYGEGADEIYYRNNPESERIPIPAEKIVSFTMGNDSFVVSHSQDIRNIPFLNVKLNTPTKIYTSLTHRQGLPMMLATGGGGGAVSVAVAGVTTIGGGTRKTYYYGTDADNVTKLEKKKFMEVMSGVMAGKPEVVAKIKDKTFKYGDMEELMEYYKTDKMPANNGNGY
jgi:hypothetical protein